jgi:predicted nucleotidyltransferase
MDTLSLMRETAHERARLTAEARRMQYEKAWDVARTIAVMLKSRYHVARVVAFGSLTQPDRFHLRSDIDLAVWGMASDDYFEAVAHVLDLSDGVEVDLVQVERCKPYLREAIEQGIEL